MSMLFDNTLSVLGAGLTARRQRQSTIAGNIANADTPGYRARRVSFADTLQKVASGEKTLDPLARDLNLETRIDRSAGRTDGNNVVMESEVAAQVSNAVEFQALGTLTKRKFGLMRYALDSAR